MDRKKLMLGVILTILGIIGIASILTMEIPLPPEAEAILKEKFTPGQIKLISLVNPAILLLYNKILQNILLSVWNLL